MIHVARLELCQALYELSGWDEASCVHECFPDGAYHTTLYAGLAEIYARNHYYPAYDLGYLLHRFPAGWWQLRRSNSGNLWKIQYQQRSRTQEIIFQAETPEDAVCKLAIELFKRGILERKKDE